MATYAATKEYPDLSLGNVRGQIWSVTHDGSTQYFNTGLNNIIFAVISSEQSSGDHQIVLNSNDGTEDTSMGALYHAAQDDTNTSTILVIGY